MDTYCTLDEEEIAEAIAYWLRNVKTIKEADATGVSLDVTEDLDRMDHHLGYTVRASVTVEER